MLIPIDTLLADDQGDAGHDWAIGFTLAVLCNMRLVQCYRVSKITPWWKQPVEETYVWPLLTATHDHIERRCVSITYILELDYTGVWCASEIRLITIANMQPTNTPWYKCLNM